MIRRTELGERELSWSGVMKEIFSILRKLINFVTCEEILCDTLLKVSDVKGSNKSLLTPAPKVGNITLSPGDVKIKFLKFCLTTCLRVLFKR